MPGESEFGVLGLAVMGQNLARNVARHGTPVAVYNRTTERTEHFHAAFGQEGPITPARTIEEFVRAIRPPRPILLMVKAGPAVDQVIAELTPHLAPGDIVIDGGNSYFADSRRRTREVEAAGFRFIGTGISGGEEGALLGPSIMPGGSEPAYRHVEPILTRIAAQVEGTPCCTYIGPDGAGHYVKMVHNGIEYADMQLIAEAYDLLSQALGLSAGELAEIFGQWNGGELNSYLIEITATVLSKTDATTGQPLVDVILDEAEQKGTGRWTSQSALDLGVPVTAITEAVFARSLSARKTERERAAGILPAPQRRFDHATPPADLVEAVRQALYASK
ncbi:MAG: NADP-dependent phosphogluconate dehydrogenase, partial [Chloroflexota bacterium]|nr:NADP-dependent phosphogluconate dehydrogenase [Chloroflexota bacterium]